MTEWQAEWPIYTVPSAVIHYLREWQAEWPIYTVPSAAIRYLREGN